MPNLFALIFCVFTLIVIVAFLIRRRLKKHSAQLSATIDRLPSYRRQSSYEQAEGKLYKLNDELFIDIATDLDNSFKGAIISSSEEKRFVDYYTKYFHEANSLLKKLEAFNIKPSEAILRFVNDYGNIHRIVKHHNSGVVKFLLEEHKDFFDHCLKYPLDVQQRRSIVSEEDNCLVVSSAGSGKTSSIIGKVKYLTEIKGVDPRKILLISYTNKAAAELTDRIDTDGLRGYTFHKLAIAIIAQHIGIKPSICDNTDSLFVKIFHYLLDNDNFKKSVIEYFVDYQSFETDYERLENEKREQLSELKKTKRKSRFPDMDGRTVYVKSEQEEKICFVLSSLGVKYRYEEPYEYQVADETHSQYCPDFSIYFEKDGEMKRIYLEHYGVDEHGYVPAWFAKDRNISYEEANQKYNDGITWKRDAHEKFETRLLTTSSADFKYWDIRDRLKSMLRNEGVPIKEKSDTDLYELLSPKGSKKEKAFIRLIVTFVTLVKSSCKSVAEILKEVEKAGDSRSKSIIKNIFIPVYERYIAELAQMGQIDFTDAILWATEVSRFTHIIDYDYIIVDEFQDISIDRYNFLKVLRVGNPPAKLYCVGDDWQSIYRFSGSDMALFNRFSEYFGSTEINKIETTYRFGEPLVSLSSGFIQRNESQIRKNIHPYSVNAKTELAFHSYDSYCYCNIIENIISSIPQDKSIFLLGRYSFDDYYISNSYQSTKAGNKFFYLICGRRIEFLTVHKSKGLEADYVILLQCNKDTYGFPSLVSDDPVLKYVLTDGDKYPYGEERRLFYVAITRAKIKTIVLFDRRTPSVFVDEFLHPEKITENSYMEHPNANKRWTRKADMFLLQLHKEGKTIKYISAKMGRSQTSINMRLNKLGSVQNIV